MSHSRWLLSIALCTPYPLRVHALVTLGVKFANLEIVNAGSRNLKKRFDYFTNIELLYRGKTREPQQARVGSQLCAGETTEERGREV